MKKKHTSMAGYRDKGKVQEVDVAKNVKEIKVKYPDGKGGFKIKVIKIPNPFKKKVRIGSSKLVTVKKGGKV